MGYKLTGMYVGNQKVRPAGGGGGYWTIANAVDAGTCPMATSNYYDECLEFSLDGLHFYTSNNATSSGPFQVDLATAWDITSATRSIDLHSTMYYGRNWNGNGTPHWNADGSQCTNCYGTVIKTWVPGSSRDLSQSATVLRQDTSSEYGNFNRGWKFIKNGEMVIMDATTYELGTAYDLRTIDWNSVKTCSGVSGGDSDSFVSDDGKHLYYTAPERQTAHLELSTAWDVSTATLVESINERASGIYFHGDKMYLKYRAGNVKQFTVMVSGV